MNSIEIKAPEDLEALVGKTVAVSEWLTITQERINQFANATDDHQWIHVDPIKAKTESPYKSTIAHGFLSFSLMSSLITSAVKFKPSSMAINYGLNKVRFPEIVTEGSKIRAHFLLHAVDKQPDNSFQMTWHVTVERDGIAKPCMVAEWLTRIYGLI